MTRLAVELGPAHLRTPLIGASGTVGSGVDLLGVADLSSYGALVAKSVASRPWSGNPSPRLAPTGAGMLNSIGIQNPGVEAWANEIGPQIAGLGTPLWGSAVGHGPDDFAEVARGLERAGVAAVEVNLSCPNVAGALIALDPTASHDVVAAVRGATHRALGAKLSPNAQDIVAVAEAVAEAGADWVVLTNTSWGAGIDIESGRPRLHAGHGGYSGPPLKPIALRCVMAVAEQVPTLPIIGCGGVTSGSDVVEYLMAGATAVALGTVHFSEPRAARRILRELERWCDSHDVASVADLIGAVRTW